MPSYTIEKKVIKETLGSGIGTVHTSTGIPVADYFGTNAQNFQLLDRNLTTGLYSKLQFNAPVDFITGDAVVYMPNENPLVGLSTGTIYYVEVLDSNTLDDNVIRLFPSRSFITVTNVEASNPCLLYTSDAADE